MLVTGCTATQKEEHLLSRVSNRVDLSWRDADRIPGTDCLLLVIDGHFCLPVKDVVDLLGTGMEVGFRCQSRGKPGLGKTLVPDRGIAMGQEFPDLGSISRGEGVHVVDVLDIHG